MDRGDFVDADEEEDTGQSEPSEPLAGRVTPIAERRRDHARKRGGNEGQDGGEGTWNRSLARQVERPADHPNVEIGTLGQPVVEHHEPHLDEQGE